MAKKKKTQVRRYNPTACDCHHLCWTKNNWDRGYARALREHPYCKVYIPRDTLHKWIHHNLRLIPVPDGKDARRCFECLMCLERAGELDYNTGIVERLDFLIDHLKTSATVEALEKQRQIVLDFYGSP